MLVNNEYRSKVGDGIGEISYRQSRGCGLYSEHHTVNMGDSIVRYESRNNRGVQIGRKYYRQVRKYYANLTMAIDSILLEGKKWIR